MRAQLDPAASLRVVDAGPSAESAQAAAFREFWGERSELRRFQARLGSISSVMVVCTGQKRLAERPVWYACPSCHPELCGSLL